MKAVVQRVDGASVQVGDRTVGAIGQGLVVLLGVTTSDTSGDVAYLATKVRDLRIFEDDAGRMNRSVAEVGGAVLVVSQFTLCADTRRGRRPSFDSAASPDLAQLLYEDFVARLRESGLTVATGVFKAHMRVSMTNDGPVTLWIDSARPS
jgi:D-tyrosyl-tRNA(Tyr) deacylase